MYTRRCARTHARMHARIVRGVRLSRRRRRRKRRGGASPCLEKEDRPVRGVFPRSRSQGRGKDTPSAFLSFLGRISPCSLATPAITYRRVITARAPSSLTLSFSLSLALSLSDLSARSKWPCAHSSGNWISSSDARSRIHGAIATRPQCDRDFLA